MSHPESQVSIIIPTRNRPELLAACLRALIAQQPPNTCEILVCDDSTGEETKTMLARDFPMVSWHRGPRNGPGANRNAGVRASRGDWLIFSDDDCLPRAGLLAAYFEAMKNPACRMNFFLAGPTLRVNDAKASLRWESPYYPDGQGLPPSCNFAISRQLFEKIGGFDERYVTAFEDIEFFARLMNSGAALLFLPNAAVEHPLRPLSSISTLANRWESRVISSLDLGASPWQLLVLIPKHVLAVILARLRDCRPTARDVPALLAFLGEFFLVLWRLPGWLMRYSRAPRSSFWAEQIRIGNVPYRFGL